MPTIEAEDLNDSNQSDSNGENNDANDHCVDTRKVSTLRKYSRLCTHCYA